jgi:hypothetical protein
MKRQRHVNTPGAYSSTPIPELAMDLALKGMEDSAVNLRALGANPDAAAYWERWRNENPHSEVSMTLESLRRKGV